MKNKGHMKIYKTTSTIKCLTEMYNIHILQTHSLQKEYNELIDVQGTKKTAVLPFLSFLEG